MSSQYPILDNRPIDQWKVTELKEELKRRKLTVRGLKDELIKRLDDALRVEREDAMKDVDNGLHCGPQDVDDTKDAETVSDVSETEKEVVVDGTKDAETVSDVSETEKEVVDLSGTTNELMDLGRAKDGVVDGITAQVDINYGAASFDQGKVQEEQITGRIDSARVEEELVVHNTTVETNITVTETVISEVTQSDQDLQNTESQNDNGNLKAQLENEDSNAQYQKDNGNLKAQQNTESQKDNGNSKAQLENEDSKPQDSNPQDSKPQLEDENLKAQREGNDSKPQLEDENSKAQAEDEDLKPHLEDENSKAQLKDENSKAQAEDEDLKPQLEDENSKAQLKDENSKAQAEDEDLKPQLEDEDLKPQLEDEDLKPQLEDEDLKPQLEDENSKAQLEDENTKAQLDNEDSKAQAEDEDLKPQLEDENSKAQLEDENAKAQLDNEDSTPPREDTMLKSSALNDQVSEVSPNLGFQVKSDSNVKLEIDVVKPKMVEPSSNEVVPVGGESNPMDVDEPHDNKVYVEEKGDNNVTNAEMDKKNDSADVGYSEKLNLDRSSGDDSMEEDVLETKQIDSKYNPDEGGDKNEKSEMNGEESTVDVRRHCFAADKKDVQVENKSPLAVPVEKRKLHDQEAAGSSEPVKRQRRWNSESLKVPEHQSPNITPTTTPKDTFQSPTLKRNFSRSDSSNSEDATKERVVPPSSKPPTNSLKIDRFLRPFTLKAVQELLGKTGTVASFWMDHIKTHCYVTYSSVEEATETRDAVYNLQWPPNGGRLLVAEFVDPQEVKIRAETPQTPTTPVTPVSTGPTVPAAPPKWQPQPSPRQAPRQQLPPPPTLPPPPPLSNPPPVPVKEWLPPPPPLPEKVDPPIVTLDDLFRKTKATPRIYYLPLSEEQVASKLTPRDRNTKQ